MLPVQLDVKISLKHKGLKLYFFKFQHSNLQLVSVIVHKLCLFDYQNKDIYVSLTSSTLIKYLPLQNVGKHFLMLNFFY